MTKGEQIIAAAMDGNEWSYESICKKFDTQQRYVLRVLKPLLNSGVLQRFSVPTGNMPRTIFYNKQLHDERIESIKKQKIKRKYEATHCMAKDKPLQSVAIKTTCDSLDITGLSDFHIGSQECDYDYIHSEVARIKGRKNNYAVVVGDICEFVTRSSLGDIFQQKIDPTEQVELAEKILAPIADKIIFWVRGNHGFRLDREVGFNINKKMAQDLNIPYFGDYAFNFLDVEFPKKNIQEFKIVSHHGASCSTTDGGRMNSIKRISSWFDFDLFIGAHIHKELKWHEEYGRWQRKPLDIKMIRRRYMTIGGSLKYWGSYAARRGYTPSGIGFPVARFYKDGRLRVFESKEAWAGE